MKIAFLRMSCWAAGLSLFVACGESGGEAGDLDSGATADSSAPVADGQVPGDAATSTDAFVKGDAGPDGGGAVDSGGQVADSGSSDKPIVLACAADWDVTDCPVCATTARCDAVTFTDQGDGTVRSTCCGLVWQKVQDATDRSWTEANAYCHNLALAGGGWRLPSIAELITITKKGVSPTIDATIFGGATIDPLWSSTDYQGYAAFEVDFSDTSVQGGDLDNGQRVRCVR